MAGLADYIETYLKQLLKESKIGFLDIQRAELAEKFGCVPSQINYVLETRFSVENGYLVESRRGGGGYIRLIKLTHRNLEELLELIKERIGDAISQDTAEKYIQRMLEDGVITQREAWMLKAAMKREVIDLDLPQRDKVRARLLKAMLVAILRESQNNSGAKV